VLFSMSRSTVSIHGSLESIALLRIDAKQGMHSSFPAYFGRKSSHSDRVVLMSSATSLRGQITTFARSRDHLCKFRPMLQPVAVGGAAFDLTMLSGQNAERPGRVLVRTRDAEQFYLLLNKNRF